MKFTPLASSSKGNCYLLEAEGFSPLLLEAGIPIRQIREKIGFRLSELAGCLVSHEHGDHSKSVKDLLKAGVDCHMSEGTAEALKIENHHRVTVLWDEFKIDVKGWQILPFDLEHDAAQPFGFLIAQGKERLLFIPDTAYCRDRFVGATIIACECNHIGEILSENIQKGHLPPVVGRRVRRNHLSLETLIKMLKANDLSKCRTIYLMHLSDGNSNEEQMKLAVQRAIGVPVYVC